jgi:hypothetical protein
MPCTETNVPHAKHSHGKHRKGLSKHKAQEIVADGGLSGAKGQGGYYSDRQRRYIYARASGKRRKHARRP